MLCDSISNFSDKKSSDNKPSIREMIQIYNGEVPIEFYKQYSRFMGGNMIDEAFDVDIYWYKDLTTCIRQDKVTGFSQYFDPNKPSLILIHGWLPDAIKNSFRQTFDLRNDFNGVKSDSNKLLYQSGYDMETYPTMLQSWKSYNIGIFHWEQFSDESGLIPTEVEKKIWGKNCTWKHKVKNEIVVETIENTNVSKILLSKLQNITTYTMKDIRLVGHSLGSQLICGLIHELYLQKNNQLYNQISRLSFLDGFFSLSNSNLYKFDAVLSFLRAKSGEFYKSSYLSTLIGATYDPVELKKACLYVEYNTDYFDFTDSRSKHVAAMWIYFLQNSGFRVITEWTWWWTPSKDEIKSGGSLASTDDVNKTRGFQQKNNVYFVQYDGNKSKNLSDDTFKMVNYLR